MTHRITVGRIFVALLLVVASAAQALPFGRSEAAGVVIDSATSKPVAGVYVLAMYTDSGGVMFGHNSSWCVRSVGMTTGEDGKFSFPGDDRASPHVIVFKEGFQEDRVLSSRGAVYAKWHEPRGTRFETIRLAPVDAKDAHRKWWKCERPEFYEDALANLRYLEMVTKEDPGRTEALRWTKAAFESLPRRNK
jgi:hypothetical protein